MQVDPSSKSGHVPGQIQGDSKTPLPAQVKAARLQTILHHETTAKMPQADHQTPLSNAAKESNIGRCFIENPASYGSSMGSRGITVQ